MQQFCSLCVIPLPINPPSVSEAKDKCSHLISVSFLKEQHSYKAQLSAEKVEKPGSCFSQLIPHSSAICVAAIKVTEISYPGAFLHPPLAG